MSVPATTVTVVVPGSATTPANQSTRQTVLVNPDGSAAGTVKKQAAQANSTATDVAGLVTDFNALLVKLRAAGVIS